MAAFTYQIGRIKFDLSRHDPAVDQVAGLQPIIWRGNDVLLEFAAFFGNDIVDISLITSVTLEIKPGDNITGTALVNKSISSGFNSALTADQWTAGTGRHFAIALTQAETTALTVTPQTFKDYWLVVRAMCSSTTTVFTLGTAFLRAMEDGH